MHGHERRRARRLDRQRRARQIEIVRRARRKKIFVVRDEQRVRCGHVSRVALDGHGDLSVAMKLWGGAPTALVVRPFTTMLSEEPPMPVILLGATPDDKPTVLAPPRTFNAGRMLRSLYVRAILVVVVLAALAALLGDGDNIVWGT